MTWFNRMDRIVAFSIVALGAVALTACNENEKPAEVQGSTEQAAQPSAAAGSDMEEQSLSAEGRRTIDRALEAYEETRAHLANDELAAAAKSAGALEKAASQAASKAPQRLRSHLKELASAANALGAVSTEDDAAARKAFGEVSRPVVALLALEGELREGRHVFECAMAKGYKKWVQSSAEISNPYMGTRMASCGSESDWKS